MIIKNTLRRLLKENVKRKLLSNFTKNFNQRIKNEELEILKLDTQNDLKSINELIGYRYMSSLASDYLGLMPSETEFRNKSKDPENHFQLETYLSNGTILWATFIYIDNNHQVILERCNIEILDSDYNTIEKLQ